MSTGWGKALSEVDAVQDRIVEALAAGQTLTEIYEGLKKADLFSGGYKAFWKNVRKIQKSTKQIPLRSWGHARTEVIALRGRIRAALTSGRSLKSIYDELKAESRISGSYIGFYKNVKKFCVQAGFPRSPAVQQIPPPPTESNVAPPRAVSTDAVAAIPAAGSAPRPAPGKGFGDKVSAGRRGGRVPVFDRTPETEEEIYGCPKLK